MDAVKCAYLIVNTKSGKVMHVTYSASEAKELLCPGLRLEVWSNDQKIGVLYHRTKEQIDQYKPVYASQEEIDRTIRILDKHRGCLTQQQYKTLKGQALAGSVKCALKGLQKIKRRLIPV